MWIFLNDAFLSIVAHLDRPDDLLVRARVPGDIERTFPGREVLELSNADYRYRAVISRQEVSAVLAERAGSIDYPNFKSSVPREDHERHDAYMGVWWRMQRLQAK